MNLEEHPNQKKTKVAEIKITKKHIIFLSLWGVLATLILYVYLTFLQPTKFTPFIQKNVQEYIPELSFNHVDFTLFPRLGVEFTGIQYKNEFNDYSLDIEATALLAQMSWISLFKGDFDIALASFVQPSISLEHKTNQEQGVEDTQVSKNVLPLSASKLHALVPTHLQRTRFEVLDGEFYFIPLQTNKEYIDTYYLNAINLNLDAFKNFDLAIKEFKLVQTSSPDNIAQNHSFSNLALSLKDIVLTQEDLTAMLNLKSDISFFDAKVVSNVESKGKIALNQDFSFKPLEQKLTFLSTFNVKNQQIPSKADFILQYIDKNTLTIKDANINIEENKVFLSAELTNLLSDPKAHIQATFKDLSIPRWLSYTRQVPNSLMSELNKVEGSFSATLDKNALITNDLRASTNNKHIVEAKVDYNFSDGHKLLVDAYIPKLNVNLLFPVLEHKTLPLVSYANETLDSLLHSNNPDKEVKFDYNIKVNANDVTFWKYNFRNINLSVIPHEKGVQIPVEITHFFDGSLTSKLIIHDTIDIDTNIVDTNVEELFKNITKNSPLAGMFNSRIKISLQPQSELEKMFSKPALDIEASLTNGAFNPYDNAFNFKKFAAHSKVSEIRFPANISDIYGFFGEHSLELLKDEHALKVHIPKTDLLYNMHTGLPDSISSSYALVEYENSFPLHFLTNGMLRFDFPNQHIVYDDIKASLYNEKITASIDFTSFTNPNIKGAASFYAKDLKGFLKKYKIDLPKLRDETALSQAGLNSTFTYADNLLKLSNLSAELDNYSFTGSLEYDFTNTKQSVFALSSPFFNADRYLDFAKKSNSTPFSSDALLPIDFISSINTVGSLSFDELWIVRTPFYNANIPMSFNKGTISLTPTALFPTSGSIATNLNIQTTAHSLDYALQAKAKDIDMLAITQAQGLETLLAGTGTFSLNAKGTATKESDIFENMQGDFSSWIEHGFFINSTKSVKATSYKDPPVKSPYVPKNLKTSFSLFSASGPIKNGVLKMGNINMTGKPIGFVGQSTIDLPKWTISLAALASYQNAAKIPISINGSLSDPELSVKIFGSLTQTFTKLTNSLVNTITDIIQKPLDLLK